MVGDTEVLFSPRAVPPVEEVRPGIWSVPVPMRGPLAYVYVYALEGPDGIHLVDAGCDSDDAFTALEAGLRSFGASVADVRGALFTHAHIDHYGLAQRVREVSGAWLAMHEREAATLSRPRGVEAHARMETWLLENGVPGEERDEVFAAIARGSTDGPARSAPPDRTLGAGPVPDLGPWNLVAVETPGHSPGHLCFVEPRTGVVFTGDHILSETTPNVGVFPGSSGSPLDDYLRSLERMTFYADALALPGHEDRIRVGARATALVKHHEEQLADAHAALVAGAETVREVAEAMRWTRPWSTFGPWDRLMALGEARAHLVLIAETGDASCKPAGPVLVWCAEAPTPSSASAAHRTM